MLVKMAFRNVFRNPKRSVLSMVTVVVGVMGMIMAYGLARGVEDTIIRLERDTEFGHLRILHKDYTKDESNLPLELQVQKPAQVIATLKKKWPQAVAFRRIVFAVDLSDGRHSLRCRGLAVRPDALEKAFKLSQYGSKKRRLVEGERSIYLGAELARTFEKKPGDTLTLLVRTKAGSLNALDFTIRDVLNTPNLMLNMNTIYMTLANGRKLLEMPKGATDVIVRLPNKSLSVPAAALVAPLSKSNFPRTWQHKMQQIIDLQKADRAFYDALIFIIMLVAAIGIANTMLMSGYERHGEIGMMMAQGMRSRAILRMFATEAAFLGLFGSLIGAVIGGAIALYFQTYGLDMSQMAEGVGDMVGEMTTMSFTMKFYFTVDLWLILSSLLLGVLISIVGSLWPAWRFTRLQPIEVLSGGG